MPTRIVENRKVKKHETALLQKIKNIHNNKNKIIYNKKRKADQNAMMYIDFVCTDHSTGVRVIFYIIPKKVMCVIYGYQ